MDTAVEELDHDQLHEDVPDEVRDRVVDLAPNREDLRLSASTDVQLDGRFGTAWVLATEQHLMATSPNEGGPTNIVHVPLAEIRTIDLRELVGIGRLNVRTAGESITIAQFSKSLTHKFLNVSNQLESLIRKARLATDDEQIVDAEVTRSHTRTIRCEQCGRVIPHWAGVCPACLDTRRLLFRLIGYAVPHWKIATFSLLLMLAATFIALTPPLLMRTLIDDVLGPTAQTGAGTWLGQRMSGIGKEAMLAVLVVLLLLVHLSQNVMGAARSYLLSFLGQRVTFQLRNDVYRHLNVLSLSFYNERETGRVMASITQDVGRLQDFISDGVQEIIRDVLTIMIICVILFILNPALAALVLLPTPFLVLATLGFGHKLHLIYRGLWRRWAGISALLADTIPGVRVVKAFAQEKREVDKFEDRSRNVMVGELRAARIRSVFTPTMAFITSLGTLLIWWVGGGKVLGGSLSLGGFVAFTGYMWQFYGPVESLCRLNHRFHRAATSADRVFETLDTQPDVADPPAARTMPRIEGRIEFRHVTFAYGDGKPVLEDVSFTVEPGEMIGLAGHSGAGKSTLVNLLARFYNVEHGTIMIDGHDIHSVTLKSLRDQIGVVLQDPFLFNGPLAENIAYGKPGASSEEVIAAAKAAYAHDFIMNLPDGYDTPVGERGVRLSGGERQRISIARAILRDPRILILDEATSSVDTETEVQIQRALTRLIEGRTTFAIAHRLSTLKHASRLLILDQGRIAEIGTHDELIASDGIYARLCRLQTEMSQLRAW